MKILSWVVTESDRHFVSSVVTDSFGYTYRVQQTIPLGAPADVRIGVSAIGKPHSIVRYLHEPTLEDISNAVYEMLDKVSYKELVDRTEKLT